MINNDLQVLFLNLIGFAILSINLFGKNYEEFIDVSSSLTTLFTFVSVHPLRCPTIICFRFSLQTLGQLDYKRLRKASVLIASIFYPAFYIVFLVCLVIMFAGVILSTYDKLRRKYQATTEALGEINVEKSKVVKDKWMNLLFCKSAEEQALEKKGDIDSDDEEAQIKAREISANKNFVSVLLYNLDQIGVRKPLIL
jgi:ABC-type multidrug transport system fused ATPase/permease subunit